MIEIPFPPSHHSKKKAERLEWANAVRARLQHQRIPYSGTVCIVLDFWAPWFKPSGKIDPKLPDCKNMLWEIEDLVAECFGYNDRANFRVVLNKHVSPVKRCTVTLRQHTPGPPGF